MRVVSFKAEEDDHVRWKKEAERLGISFGSFARNALDAYAGEQPAPPHVPRKLLRKVKETRPSPPTVVRSSKQCDERRPKGSWCATCDQIHA